MPYENALNFDVAEIRFLAGPWDGSRVLLGKQFGAPDRIYVRPFFTVDGEGMLTYYAHSGFVTDHPETNTATYSLAFASDPKADENGNMKAEFHYLYARQKRWTVTRGET